MPVLEPTGRIHALRGVAETERPNALQIPRPTPNSPSMDHLDALEAQSIYIFREAFARLKKLALLWSLGKDSNVMIWLARKAFFGRVPFPALHVDTGKKFPEMYSFRDRYGKEWQLDLKIEPCPPLETIDPTLPPAARSAARKTDGGREPERVAAAIKTFERRQLTLKLAGALDEALGRTPAKVRVAPRLRLVS